MGEDKFERVISLKNRLIGLVESQIDGDLNRVNAAELGEVMDMAKDCAELMRNYAETEYYCKITEAMEQNSSETNMSYIEKYFPETQRYYTPTPDYRYDDKFRDRMYYTEVNKPVHDIKDGRSYISRRGYMETQDKTDLEKYMQDLSVDITEMIEHMDTTDRQMLKQKLTQLITKIG